MADLLTQLQGLRLSDGTPASEMALGAREHIGSSPSPTVEEIERSLRRRENKSVLTPTAASPNSLKQSPTEQSGPDVAASLGLRIGPSATAHLTSNMVPKPRSHKTDGAAPPQDVMSLLSKAMQDQQKARPASPSAPLAESEVLKLLTKSNGTGSSLNGNAATANRPAAAATTTVTSSVKSLSSPSNITSSHATNVGVSAVSVAASATNPTSKSPNPANAFLVTDVLGGGPIDNFEATTPIIRTVPTLPPGGRYIIVGDVHGCSEQLETLVDKVKFRKGTDLLIIIGDYVNKGPDSIGVIRLCQRLGALGVLGNHDLTLLKCCAKLRRRFFSEAERVDPVKRLAEVLPPECEQYLRGLPHMLRIPAYKVVLVHAGLNFEVPLEKQNVMEIMHMRRLERIKMVDPLHPQGLITKYNAITKGHSGVPWASLWEGPEHVIFGHDASAGFQAYPFAYGIDTGCVYGDPLTCVVYSEESPKGEFFSVKGLPRNANEKVGLPPPESDVYDDVENLEKLIYRPTPRATPYTPNGGTPTFIATPPSAVQINNAFGLSAAQVAAPPALTTAQPPLTAAVSGADSSAVQLSLLTLANARELRSLSLLLELPCYEATVSKIVSDEEAHRTFWEPFCKAVLSAIATSPAQDDESLGAEENVLQCVLDVCDESPKLLRVLQPQLRSIRDRGASQKQWSKGIKKYLTVLLD